MTDRRDAPAIVVTGASRGIGAAVALEAARAGTALVLAARDAARLDDVAARALGAGAAGVECVAGDLADPGACARVVDSALAAYGRVDALVNNAGVLAPIGALADTDPEAWGENLRVNVLAPAWLARAALPHLRARGGRVVNVSSGAAVKAIRGWSAYCTSKAALNHLTRVLAAEEPDVVAIAFSPGMTDTDMQSLLREQGRGRMPQEDLARFVDAWERGTLARPDDVARAIVALATRAPEALSGEFLDLNDRRVAKLVRKS